ncbi:MAG: hypothetical protein IT518_11535 [Burkholderiales bacterium]|nr:hypothetical protein [Burkholderiales bacterium]
MRSFILSLLFAAAAASAQTPPPAALLPDPGALPRGSADTRLPGPDPRQCGDTRWSALCAQGRWAHFSRIDFNVAAPQFTAHYTIEQAANGEQHTTYREQFGKAGRRGEVVVFGVEGLAYRSPDKFPEAGSIIDYTVSSPLMMAQLAALLLDQGALVAPAEIGRPENIRAENATQYIRTAAPRMTALYGPPWSMTGTVRPAGPGQVAFSLRLRYRPVDGRGVVIAGTTQTVALEGTASYAPRRATLPDSFDLVGWKVQRGETPVGEAKSLADARKSAGM